MTINLGFIILIPHSSSIRNAWIDNECSEIVDRIHNVKLQHFYNNNCNRDFALWTMHFLMMSKRPTNASLIQCIGA
jgi:hypothetical protein